MTRISRRSFIKNTSGTTLALWLGISSRGYASIPESLAESAKNFTPYILIESNGNITIYNTKPEMGQGTYQSIPALIAEELEVSLAQVTIKQASGEKELDGQWAGGSASVRYSYMELRKVGASAREVLIEAAAKLWQVDKKDCYAENGKVLDRLTKKAFTYGELVEEASKIELPKEPKLKDPKDFKILGKSQNRPDVPLKTNGKAEFGIDVQVPGMVYATIERCPVLGGTLKSFDASEALKMPGVLQVVSVDKLMGKYLSTGVAVIANGYWNALQARKKLKIEWDAKGHESFNSVDFDAHLRTLAQEPGLTDRTIGDLDALNIAPKNTLEALYETPLVAHHPMEPMNCVAQVKGDQVEIWTSTQVPVAIIGSGDEDLFKYIGFKPENIKLNTRFIGGGFGRRLYLDYIIEAVNLAKQTKSPVKVIWTREDTTQHSPVRPMTFSQLKGGFAEDGKLIALHHKVISPSYSEGMSVDYDATKVDGMMMEAIADQAYEIPNLKTSFVRADFHVPVAAWRSVTSSTLAFAHECFIDELAHKAQKDPMDFRLGMMTKSTDAKRVLLKLREVSHWDTPLPKGKGRGVGQWEFFAGLCAHVVEVTYNADKSIQINKVYAVIDLGEVVNPDNVRNQVEGAIVMALVAAVKPGITLENGKIKPSNYHDNPMVRINEMPDIEVHIMAEGGTIKGVGEPGLPPFAPALANAIFAATGKRIRKMPFDLSQI